MAVNGSKKSDFDGPVSPISWWNLLQTFHYWLVVFRPTPLKNDGVKVSWDDEIPNWMESHRIHMLTMYFHILTIYLWLTNIKIHVPNHQPDFYGLYGVSGFPFLAPRYHPRVLGTWRTRTFAARPWKVPKDHLVGGLEHEFVYWLIINIWLVYGNTWLIWNFMTFHILGISSSRLTNSIIFQRGRYTTNQLRMIHTGFSCDNRPMKP